MKKIVSFFLILLLASACDKTVSSNSPINQSLKKKIGPSSLYGGGCQICTTPSQPDGYTTGPDAFIATLPGYGIYSNPNYDKGYYEGYNEGVDWLNDYLSQGQCTGIVELEIEPVGGGATKLINPAKTPVPDGDYIVATEFVYTCKVPGINIDYIMCETAYYCGPYSLRLQYEYNNTYPKRTSAQSSFDSGRLQGFLDGTTHLPFVAN